jgi:hypothetical protein
VKFLLVLVAVAGCGRLGFDTNESPVGGDASVGGGCPSDTLEIADSGVCIEKAQRGTKTWIDAKGDCTNLGRRLCGGGEWVDGCDKLASLQAMVDDWEWVAEETGGIADKRGGAGACSDTSSHEIDTDPYGYRCCVDE